MRANESMVIKHGMRRATVDGRGRAGGFALIVTVSLLTLLALVAVGLLSLSAITVRGGTMGAAQAEARANARLGMMMAMAALQRDAGLDTRVTAPAGILEDGHPALTGVWKSWEGSDHLTSGRMPGRPEAPDYDAKERPASGGGRFLSWLVSGAGRDAVVPGDAGRLVRGAPFAGSVPLVSDGTLAADDERAVHVAPVELDGARGAYAWWVSGENQKARLPEPYKPENDDAAGWSVLAKSHAVADPSVFGLDRVLDHPEESRKALSLATTNLLAGTGPGDATGPARRFHDLSTVSVGLLTNTATGGWRKDLSLLTENWDRLSPRGLAVFGLEPGESATMDLPRNGSHRAPGSIFYPWSSYRADASRPPIYQHGAVATWHHLMDYATFYQRVRVGRDGQVAIPSLAAHITNASDSFNFLHRIRTVPVVARVHWVFSHYSVPRAGATGDGTHEVQLLLNPVVTMWNPYNVAINAEPVRIIVPKNLPCAFQYEVGDSPSPFRCLLSGSTNYQSLSSQGQLTYEISRPYNLAPGETRVFSPSPAVPRAADSPGALQLQPGYRPGAGHFFQVKDRRGNPVVAKASDRIRVSARFDTAYLDRSEGVGIYLDLNALGSGQRQLAYRMVYTREMANAIYESIDAAELTQPTVGEVEGFPQPFLSTVFGTRLASESHLPAKGFVQSSPLVNYTAMGSKSMVETDIGREYTGVMHPVNSPFDYSFLKHAPGDSRLPNESADSSRGFIVSGFDKSTGLSRITVAELPLRPLCSLAELQNWDLRYENPVPPFQFNIIGNSDASPLLPADAVVNSDAANLTVNLQHDDSYCANHLLFDDWFFSSIARNPVTFGRSGSSLEDTYVALVTEAAPLDNRAYRPIREDVSRDKGDAAQLFDREVNGRESYRTIASRLEVVGMFNVNSTSVAAWRALLGHARDQQVPHYVESGANWSVDLSEESDHPVSRFSVAGDVAAGQSGSSGAFPDASEFSGYRLMTESMLDELAEEIVREVRLRGPFLSLSEFVNRQLSSGKPALAGAVQSALNTLAEGSSNDPFVILQQLSRDAGPGLLARRDLAGFQFEDAAVGESAFGLPGWTRQADILRPLAPILSARDDTFTIRAYGDARDASGQVRARATCEAVVRRGRDFVSGADDADITGAPATPVNERFGRRFEVVSFRWLHPDEV